MAFVAATQEISLANARRPSLALIALSLNLAVTLPLAYILNIWQDEAYTLQTTGRSLLYAFTQALSFEQNAPLYFVFLTAWRHMGTSIFFLRLPSILCIALAIALVPELSRRYIPSIDPGLATLVAAWNPFVIWAAVEMRVYALVILLSALLLLSFFDAFLARRPSKVSAVAYAVCCVLALYTQYYLGFLIAAQGLTLLLLARRQVGRFALCAAAAGLAFAPMLAIVPAQVQNFKSAFTPPSFPRAVEVLGAILARYALPLSFPHAKLAYLVVAIAAIAAAVAARKKFTGNGDGTILLITIRTFLRRPLHERAALAWSCVALLASTATLVQTYAPLAKPGDWVRATAYLRAHERPREPIVVFEAENALPLAHYYNGPNRVVAIPRGVDFRRYDVSGFVLHSTSEVEAAVPPAPRVWLVTAGECSSANIRFGCDVLERFVATRYRVVSDVSFYGSRIRLLRRTLPAGKLPS